MHLSSARAVCQLLKAQGFQKLSVADLCRLVFMVMVSTYRYDWYLLIVSLFGVLVYCKNMLIVVLTVGWSNAYSLSIISSFSVTSFPVSVTSSLLMRTPGDWLFTSLLYVRLICVRICSWIFHRIVFKRLTLCLFITYCRAVLSFASEVLEVSKVSYYNEIFIRYLSYFNIWNDSYKS